MNSPECNKCEEELMLQDFYEEYPKFAGMIEMEAAGTISHLDAIAARHGFGIWKSAIAHAVSTHSEKIKELEGMVAMQADALNEIGANSIAGSAERQITDSALSATAETVQSFRDTRTAETKELHTLLDAKQKNVNDLEDQIEPLRREVAMLQALIKNIPKLIADNCFGNTPPDGQVSFKSAHLCVLRCEHDHYQDTGVWLFKTDQATAQAYKTEVEARGAVKALEELLVCDDITNTGYIHKSAIQRRATSKKAG